MSSFGFGGTNAHAVLEEAPPAEPTTPSRRTWQALTISARSSAARDEAARRLSDHLAAHPEIDLADVAFTLHAFVS